MIEDAIGSLPSVSDSPEFWGPIIEALAKSAQDTRDKRGSAACARVLVQLRAQQLGAMVEADKLDRLDTGRPTERVTFDFEPVKPLGAGRN